MTWESVSLRVVAESEAVWVTTAILEIKSQDHSWFGHYLDEILLADASRKALHHEERFFSYQAQVALCKMKEAT